MNSSSNCRFATAKARQEGTWMEPCRRATYHRQSEAMAELEVVGEDPGRRSWDVIIETFLQHILAGEDLSDHHAGGLPSWQARGTGAWRDLFGSRHAPLPPAIKDTPLANTPQGSSYSGDSPRTSELYEFVNVSVDATPINDPLKRYLLALREGRDNTIEIFPADQYQVGHGVIGHEGTGIIVKCPALYVASPEDDEVVVLYHYAPEAAYSRIAASTDLSHLKASYAERAHFGDGVYTTQYAPHEFESKDAVLRNNYTNKADPDQQETQISRWREAGAVDYCIPIIVRRSVAVNVMFEKTKEMQKPGHTARHNEPIRADRDVWVIVVSNAAGHAESAREHPESIWIQLRDESWVARLHAVEFLAGVIATSVDSEATDAIIKCLHDNDRHVCVAAIWAVACSKALPSVRAQQLISQAIDYNTHPSVKAAIVDAIEFLSLSANSSD